MKPYRIRFQGVFFVVPMLGLQCFPLYAQDKASTEYINDRAAIAAYNNGLAAVSNGNFDGAISDFSLAIALNFMVPEAYCDRGNVKTYEGDLGGAIADFNKAIELDPLFSKAYFNRGLTKQKMGDFDGALADYNQAIADYNQAVALNFRIADAYCDRGNVKTYKGDLDGAIADYNRAIEIDPRFDRAYCGRGNAKATKGDLKGGFSDLDQALEINPRFAAAHYFRGLVEDRKNEHKKAVDDYNEAISLKCTEERNSSSRPSSFHPDTGRGIAFGTGFFVTSTGYLFTDFNVVKGATAIRVKIGSVFVPARLVVKDAINDIALLKVDGTYACVLLGDSSVTELGETVFAIGFPEPELHGLSPKHTIGDISSLAGLQDDPRKFQVVLSLQPGNSGGCLVDESGSIVGLIEATLSKAETAKQTSDFLQNVNYATKINYAKVLLDTVHDAKPDLISMKVEMPSFEDQMKTDEDATVFIIADSSAAADNG